MEIIEHLACVDGQLVDEFGEVIPFDGQRRSAAEWDQYITDRGIPAAVA